MINTTPDDAELRSLDPFDALDQEAERLDEFFSTLQDTDWGRPTRCDAWSIRDVLAHLLASEAYHHACLDGTVAAFNEQMATSGGTNLEQFNAIGVAKLSDRSPAELLAEWRVANAETRRRFRERDEGVVDTSVGDYPCRWQAFHVASELATHADDIGVAITADEVHERRAWRAAISRFALAETKPEVAVTVEDGRTRIRGRGVDVVVDDEEIVEGVAARLDDSSPLDGRARKLLSAMP